MHFVCFWTQHLHGSVLVVVIAAAAAAAASL
jgi:hypothetical protein